MENVYVSVHKFTEDSIHAKFYQNRSGFVEDMTKHNGVFFSVHSVDWVYRLIVEKTTKLIIVHRQHMFVGVSVTRGQC